MACLALDARSVFPGMGGIGRYTSLLAQSLPPLARADEVHLLLTEKAGPALPPLAPNVVPHAFACGMIDARWEQLQLPGELARLGADLYHATCFAAPAVAGPWRTVVTVHDVIFRRHPELVDPTLCAYLDHWTAVALAVADAVITVSAYSKREITALYPVDPAKVQVVYNGVGPRFRPLAAAQVRAVLTRLQVPAGYVLYVGAMEAKKNVPRLLGAWKQVVAQLPHRGRKLVLVGGSGGQAFNANHAIQAAGVEASVLQLGQVSEPDLVALYSGAELFVYPSLYEGFGLPVLEAMACGAPVLTANTGALAEIAGSAALCVDPLSVPALADGMARVLEHPTLAKHLRSRGRAHSATFSQARCSHETLAVYDRVLGRVRGQAAPATGREAR